MSAPGFFSIAALAMLLVACESQPPATAVGTSAPAPGMARLRLIAMTANNTLAKDWPDESCGKGVRGRDIALVSGQFPFSASRVPQQKIGIPLSEEVTSKQVTEFAISATARHHLNLRAIVNYRAIGTTVTSSFCTRHVSFKPIAGESYELVFTSEEVAQVATCTAVLSKIVETGPGRFMRVPDETLDIESTPC